MEIETYQVQNFLIRLQSFPGVTSPTPFSIFLATHQTAVPGRKALDVGCGSGLLSILLALRGWRSIMAADINELCLEATRHNAELNGCGPKVELRQSDLYSDIPADSFDLIISNPPTLPATQDTPSYYRAAENGRGFLDPLIRGAPRHLVSGGVLTLIHSSLADIPRTLYMLEEVGLVPSQHQSRWLAFREFYMPHLEFFQSEARAGRAMFREEEGQFLEQLVIIEARKP